ncbi:MAG: DUF3127 domain-containing protein [Kiritimatiellae bacterium]|nr:DUF3127 domain-containing protein [Kiritimatiellia bacterium]
MSYEMTGTVKKVCDAQTFASGFTKREFVLTTEDDRYPQDIAIACIKDGCAQLDGIQAGERLRVAFRIRGREYNGRYFVNLEAYKLERLDGGASDEAAAPAGGNDEPPLDDGPMPF